MKLVLGVTDVPYTDKGDTSTTGEVAQILENRYHPMEIYAEEHGDEIADWLAQAMVDQLADVASGAPVPPNPFMDAEEKIRTGFQDFLSSGEIELINPQLPTAAAIAGRSKRRKSGTTGQKRVSLIDTGLYQASFRAWMEDYKT